MKEIVYINQERRDALRHELASMEDSLPVPKEDKLISTFDVRHFPDRECLLIRRNRTRAEVWSLIAEWSPFDKG